MQINLTESLIFFPCLCEKQEVLHPFERKKWPSGSEVSKIPEVLGSS